jgi:hypothetical protein
VSTDVVLGGTVRGKVLQLLLCISSCICSSIGSSHSCAAFVNIGTILRNDGLVQDWVLCLIVLTLLKVHFEKFPSYVHLECRLHSLTECILGDAEKD